MEAKLAVTGQTPAPSLFRGAVLEELGGGRLMVAGESSAREAVPAASCLLAPEVGDEVLCVLDGETVFVLGVLTRIDPGAEGRVRLPGRSSLDCGELSIGSSKLSVRSAACEIEAARMTLSGDHLAIRWRLVRMAARIASAAFGSFLAKSRDLRLKVEEGAAIETGRLSVKARQDLTARAESVDLRAAGPVVIDGRHLRLG